MRTRTFLKPVMMALLLLLGLAMSLTGLYRPAQAKEVTPINGVTTQENFSLAPSPGDENLGPVVSPILTPTNILLNPDTLFENEITGTVVGTFTTEGDDDGETHNYELVDSGLFTDNDSFTIENDVLKTVSPFDYEVKSSYSIKVRSTGTISDNFFVEKTFAISVTDINEAPTNIDLDNDTIAENVGTNAPVGTFSATDQDAGQTHTYTLVTGTGSSGNGAFNISGSTLRATNSLDFETQSSYSIRVQVTDNGVPSQSHVETFTIDVIDVKPVITVAKMANPISVPETGTNVTFTIRITNTSQENATLVAFSDSVFNLNTRCPDWPNKLIAVNQTYTCAFTVFVSGDYPGNHQNIVTATAQDNENPPNQAFGVGTVTVPFTDVKPNLSIAYTPNPSDITELGSNVTFSVLVTNLSTEVGTLTLLQDSTFGNLNGQGTCGTNGALTPSGGTYSCSFTKFISGSAGTNRVYTATARLADDDGNTKNASDNATVAVGELFRTYLPFITKPGLTELHIDNDTGGPVTFTVVEAGVSCNVPAGNQNFLCGSFPEGMYTVQVNSICGSLTTPKTYNSGYQLTQVFCN